MPKLAHTILVALIFTLLMFSNALAISIQIQPKEVVPGDVFLLKILGDIDPDTHAEFMGHKFALYPVAENSFIALLPVDINTDPDTYNISITHGEVKYHAEMHVKAHKFKTIQLVLPEEKVTLSPKNQERAVREASLLKKIWMQNTEKTWNRNFIAPTDTELSEVFGVKRIMNEKKTSIHRGVDYRGKKGTPVRAINAGTVALNDDLFFGGLTLVVDHGMGLYSIYMHLSKFNVSAGDKVDKGKVVGFIGSSGRSTGPHLHMSVKLGGVSVNPESFFKLEF
jgi:hypothetical protein